MLNNPHTINILIVDDSVEILAAITAALEMDGIQIYSTSSPKEALSICTQNDISIALIDINMPEMNGLDLLKLIKNNPLTDKIMVIMITGYSMDSRDVVIGLTDGAVDYLFKPLDLYITIAKVKSLTTIVNYQREIQLKNQELERSQTELVLAIESAEKNKVIKENFLANMSHEIRTPLNAIIGLTHLLKEIPADNDQEEIIKLMDYSSKSLLGIVNDILESSKINAGKIQINTEDTNISYLFQTTSELIQPMANEKGLELLVNIAPNVPDMVIADPLRLNQIMMNLLNNAIKFTSEGHIEANLDIIEHSEESVHLAFTVKDTGAGLSQSSIDKVFDRFEQIESKTWQKFGGTGLGLSIVKQLIELMDGEMSIESEVGKGTTFTFKLWLDLVKTAESRQTVEQQINKLEKFSNLSILLAEDNAINQFVALKILKRWDINVDVVENGLEAFERLKIRDYDLILMDTHMPVMNGNDATRKIRRELEHPKRNIPIISFSASVIQNEKDLARQAGVNDFVEKPFDILNLHKKIRKFTAKAYQL